MISQKWDFGLSVSHCSDVLMSEMVSQIASPTIIYSTIYSRTDQRKHKSSASLAFEMGIHPAQRASNAENVSIWWRRHAEPQQGWCMPVRCIHCFHILPKRHMATDAAWVISCNKITCLYCACGSYIMFMAQNMHSRYVVWYWKIDMCPNS